MSDYTVNRFEVIDHTGAPLDEVWQKILEGSDQKINEHYGRRLVKREEADFEVELSLQDDGRTLKVFLSDKEKSNES